jgi:hypothetical protein
MAKRLCEYIGLASPIVYVRDAKTYTHLYTITQEQDKNWEATIFVVEGITTFQNGMKTIPLDYFHTLDEAKRFVEHKLEYRDYKIMDDKLRILI